MLTSARKQQASAKAQKFGVQDLLDLFAIIIIHDLSSKPSKFGGRTNLGSEASAQPAPAPSQEPVASQALA